MKRGAIVCPVLVVLLLVSVFHMTGLQLPSCKGASSDQKIVDMQPQTIESRITGSELELLKSSIGVEEENQNYNQIVYDHGTGLVPPSEADWEEIWKEAYVVDQVSSPASLPSNVDNSATSWFPPIGNQGSQGSCVAWAVGYYVKTFQEAKEHGWSLSGAIPNEIMSPSFIYNLIDYGVDKGSSFSDAMQLVCSVGDCSLAKMPYNAADCTSWPSEQAWNEAPLYRGDANSISYMILQNDSDLANLKSWLASGNLAILAVDADKIADPFWGTSRLDWNDMLTLDNYVNPSPNHAGTIVGYEDNFAYTEQGQTHYGAFKIANSWGIPLLPWPFPGGWEHNLDGCYWISYDAMKERVGSCMVYRDKMGYVPTLTASFRIAHPLRGECNIMIGMGTHSSPTVSKSFTDYIHGGNQPFCSNNIVFDITEFEDAVPNIVGKPFFLSVYDGGSPATGTILYFSVRNTVSSNPPVNTVNGGYVYADLTLETSVMWVEPSAVNFNAGTTSVGFKFNITVAMNITENVFAYQIGLRYNRAQLKCTRAGYTAGATSQFFAGHTTNSPPPVIDTSSLGNGSVLGFETLSGSDHVAGPHCASLMWAEFQILLAPSEGQILNSTFDISTEYASWTWVLDTNLNNIAITPHDGNYQLTGAPATVYIMSDGSVVPSYAPISSIDNVTYTFTGNVSYSTYEGIVVERSNIVIDGNGYTVQGNQSGDTGLSLTGVSNVTIKNTNIKGFQNGIYLSSSNNNNINGVNATANGQYGIYLYSSSNNTVSGNNATVNTYGIWLSSSNNNTVSGNNATANIGVGIFLDSSSNNTVSANKATANNNGIYLFSSSNNNTVSGNNASANGFGICLYFASDNVINGNNAMANSADGIYLSNSSCIITANNIADNGEGIYLDSSSNSSVSGNIITANNGEGIYLYSSSNNSIVENNITANSGAGIFLESSDNNTISGNIVTINIYAVTLSSSSGNTVSGNDITNNWYGIYVLSSSNNGIGGNSIIANDYVGIWLSSSNDNSVGGNNVTANTVCGIELASSSNNGVGGNHIANNGGGIWLGSSSNNSISENNVTTNAFYGIWLSSSSNNTIYHTNFTNNTSQVSSSNSTNVWDDGYPSGGNYWSDYNGTDSHNGPYQNETGSDGIGDLPYVIDASNQDNYALMNPYPTHDVVAAGVVAAPSVVCQGYGCVIEVSIANTGDFAEAFNVTVYANMTATGSVTAIHTFVNVILNSRDSATLTFTWNTSGFDLGNYRVSASAASVQGETDIADNTFVDGVVQIIATSGGGGRCDRCLNGNYLM